MVASKWQKILNLLLIVLLVSACSSGAHKKRNQLRILVKQKQYGEAHKLLENSKDYKTEDFKLLYFLEKGLIHHEQGQHLESIKFFSKAKDLSEKLFTKSIKNKLQSVIANDTYDKYYGESYERSLIHFYLIMNRIMIYQKGHKLVAKKIVDNPEKPDEFRIEYEKVELSKNDLPKLLWAARAEVLAWDSVLEVYRQDKSGKSIFKNDLLAKVLGAYVHELIGTTKELNVAYQLYRDARELLFKNYNSYPSFNKESVKFNSNFSKLHKMKLSDVKKKFVSKSIYYDSLDKYLEQKELELAYKVRRKSFNRLKRKLKLSKAQIKDITRPKNVKIIFQNEMIPNKIPEKHYYTLNSVLDDPKKSKGVKVLAAIGSTVLSVYAANELGLLPPPASYSPAGAHLGVNTASAVAGELGIKFELPAVEKKPLSYEYSLNVYSKNDQQKVYKEVSLPVVNPMGDLARQAVAEHAAAIYGKLGTRLAIKHLSAIAASYVTYNALKEKSGKFIAKNAAVIQYLGASRAIQASEKADTRFWSTLPYTVNLADFNLPKGEYMVQVKKKNVTNNEVVTLPTKYPLNVEDERGKVFLNIRI